MPFGPFPKKYDNPSEKVRKESEYLDDIKKVLVTTIDTVVKEGTTNRVDKKGKHNLVWWRKPSLLLFKKKIIFTQSTKQRNQKHPIKQLIHPKEIKLTQLNQHINQGLLK